MAIADILTSLANKIPRVFESGKKAEYDAFWDDYQRPINANNCNYGVHAYAGHAWTNKTFKPKHDIRPTSAYMMFRYSSIEGDLVAILDELGVKLDFTDCWNYQQTFEYSKFTRIGKVKVNDSINYMFGNCTLLETIDNIVTKTNIGYSYAFQNCNSLKNIRFTGEIGKSINFQWCPLTAESIVSVVEALSSSVSGQTATFKQTAVDNADWSKTNHSDWNALIANKQNWTFSLI